MNRIVLSVAAVTGLVLALAGGALLGHRAAPRPLATQVVRFGPASLVVPRAWHPVRSTGSAAIFDVSAGQRAVVTLEPVRTPPPSARATVVANYRAWRERSVTVLPTSVGVVAIDCATCADAIQEISVRGAAVLDPTPDLAVSLSAPDIVAAFDRARVLGRDELQRAVTPAGQSRWARRLAAAHAKAATELAPVVSQDLLARFAELRSAYSDLARAAMTRSAGDFDAARARIAPAETELTRSLGDIPPPPVQPHAVAPAPAVRHGVPPSVLVLVILLFASLGAAVALLRGPLPAPRPARRPTLPPWLATLKAAARHRPRPELPRWPARAVPPTPQPAADGWAAGGWAASGRPAAPAPADPVARRPTGGDAPTARPTAPLPPDPAARRRARSDQPATRDPVTKRPARTDQPATRDPITKRPARSDAPAGRPAAPAPAEPVARRRTRNGALLERPAAERPAAERPAQRATARRRQPPRRGAPVPPNAKWTCELAWSASFRRAGFVVQAQAPGEEPVEIARSGKVSWPPLVPPTPDAEVLAAARSVARALVKAGWTPTTKGSDWYAQRFAWARDGSPPTLGTISRRS